MKENMAIWRMTDLLTQPVGKRIDAEGGLLDKGKSKNSSIYKTTLPITPSQPSNEHREQHPENQDDRSIVLVLPDDDGVLIQIGNIGPATVFGVLIQNHPHEMRVPETFHDAVRVLDCVGPSVVCPVLTAPPPD
jgi:hypothetical protein